MSQNKTIIPDVDYGNLGTDTSHDTYADFYSPSGLKESTQPHTYIGSTTGPHIPYSSPQQQSSFQEIPATGRRVELQERVMTGVLFSISKDLLGEIFPLYLGRNLIGFTQECDIRLSERTVSSVHALIQVSKDFDTNTSEITVTDYGSNHGTMVNGENGTFGSLILKENDILTIGKHYQFIVKLFNPEKAGLYEDPDFEDPYRQHENSTGMATDFYAPSRNSDSNRTVIC